MARTKVPALPAGVKLLRKRIEEWRRTRDRRTAMPADLWDEAVALARPGRAWAVARALGISFRWWPSSGDAGTSLRAHELQVLLCGGDPTATRVPPEWRHVAEPAA